MTAIHFQHFLVMHEREKERERERERERKRERGEREMPTTSHTSNHVPLPHAVPGLGTKFTPRNAAPMLRTDKTSDTDQGASSSRNSSITLAPRLCAEVEDLMLLLRYEETNNKQRRAPGLAVVLDTSQTHATEKRDSLLLHSQTKRFGMEETALTSSHWQFEP